MPKSRISSVFLKAIFIAIVLVLVLIIFPKKTSDFQFDYSQIAQIDIPQNYPIHGIDVSHYNGDLQWKAIKQADLFDTTSLKFVFIKATEGKTLKDSHFSKNWNNSKKHGFVRGAYHFYIASRDPIEQAKNFCKTVKLEKGDLPPVCDFEGQYGKPKIQIKKDLIKFLDYIQNHFDVLPILYTNSKLYELIIDGDDSFTKYKVWLASYERKEIKFRENLLMWQHNTLGKVPGSSKSIDYNVFLGSESDFNSILIK